MFKKLFRKNKPATVDIVAPVTGRYVNLSEVPDPVFSGKMMGDGVAIQPKGAKTIVVAPVSGKILMLADSYHAVGIKDVNGVEILIHVGLDTVELKGKGFKPLVSVDGEVKVGQPLIEVDLQTIEESGKNTVIPVVVTNQEEKQYRLIHNKQETVQAGITTIYSVELTK